MIKYLSGMRTRNDRAASSSARQWTLSADTGLGTNAFSSLRRGMSSIAHFGTNETLNDVGPMLSLGSLIGDLF